MSYPVIGKRISTPTKTKIRIFCIYVHLVFTYEGPVWELTQRQTEPG